MSCTVRSLTQAFFRLLHLEKSGLFVIMLASLSSMNAAVGASVNKLDETAKTEAQPGKETVSSKAVPKKSGKFFSGNISWYGAQFNGKKTACGDIFDMNKKTAAHRTLPFHSKVLVEDPRTGQSVVVVVNDRGPFVKTRVMDVSRQGAVSLGTIHKGVCCVDCTVLDSD